MIAGDLYRSRSGLTSQELLHLGTAVSTEERLSSLLWMGATDCVHPQLQSFFAHTAETNGKRLEELSDILQNHAGFVS